MAYNKVSQLTQIDRFSDLNGTQLVAESDYTYDSVGRLIQLKRQRGSTIYADYQWTYDMTAPPSDRYYTL